ALQQAAEMALFDTGAKELALAAYDSGETPEQATEAYRKARADGTALVLGPLFGASAKALAPLVAQGGANVVSFSNDEQAAQRGGAPGRPRLIRQGARTSRGGARRPVAGRPTGWRRPPLRPWRWPATWRASSRAAISRPRRSPRPSAGPESTASSASCPTTA